MNAVCHISLLAILMLGGGSAHALSPDLTATHERVMRKYDRAAHMNIADFTKRLNEKPNDFLVFDVRELEEFQVSHMDGAIQLDPKIRRRSFLKTFKEQARGKTVIFYCSAGYRSSRLAEKMQSKLLQNGAAGVYNLRGGLFAWHNQNRALVDFAGATDFIHPYNKKWQSLVERSAKLSYTAEN